MLTLAQARYQLLRKPAYSSVDPAIANDLINEACEMLLTFSKPKDCLDRIGVTVYAPEDADNAILTLPRGYLMAEAVMRNKVPLQIRNGWFEFSLAGRGSVLADDDVKMSGEMHDMGDGYCCIREPVDINADGCRLKVYTDAQSGAEVYESIIEFYGLDADGAVIRTSGASSIRDGEAVNLVAATGNVTTTASFARITQVVKPITNGVITVYAVDPDDSSEHLIARYEPSERIPNYHRYMVPPAPDGTDSYTATVLARRRFVMAEADNDVLSIDHFGALLYGILYIGYRDVNDDDRAKRALGMAMDILSRQAARARPAGQYPPPVVNLDNLEHDFVQGY